MSYNFTPLNDEELNAINLVEDGVYRFEVIKSTRKTSKSGNSMAELNIKFWDKDGKMRTIFDYLVFSDIALNIRKIKHFLHSTGLDEYYKKGEVPEELGGYSGKFELGTQDEQPKSGGGFYPKKNYVVDYVMTDAGAVKYESPKNDFMNDSIPF